MDPRLSAESLCETFDQVFKERLRELPVVSLAEYVCAADRVAVRAAASAELFSEHLCILDSLFDAVLKCRIFCINFRRDKAVLDGYIAR